MQTLKASLAIATLLMATVIFATAQKKAELSDAQYTTKALSAAPASVAKDATVVRMDSDGKMKTLREGKNGFTCMIASGNKMCADVNSMEFFDAWMKHQTPPDKLGLTYMLAGDDNPEDILRSVKRGLYAVNFGGGQVDITNGKFVFSASEAYLIEDGKVTAPVRDATLIGNGPEALKYVSMVGNDLKMDEGIGTCGKDGQSVPVGVGMPTVKLDRMTVGGTGR